MEAKPLYNEIGGEPAINATVSLLYDKILQDDLLAPFFDDIDINRLRRSQSAFVGVALGGPTHYEGAGMRHAHAKLVKQGLSDVHFDRVAMHLADAMRELQVEERHIEQALAIIETTRDDVLNR